MQILRVLDCLEMHICNGTHQCQHPQQSCYWFPLQETNEIAQCKRMISEQAGKITALEKGKRDLQNELDVARLEVNMCNYVYCIFVMRAL